jgi:MSHA pilin protein MshC
MRARRETRYVQQDAMQRSLFYRVTRDVHGRTEWWPCRNNGHPHAPRAPRGYTLIELVVVITILAIIAAIAGPRFFSTRVFSERGYADEVATAMRYAQKIAVASGCNVRLTITAAGYNAMQQVASGNRCNTASAVYSTTVRRPDGDALAGAPPSDANVSGPATLTFDNKGVVISGATNLMIGAYTLALDAASGFVVVQ